MTQARGTRTEFRRRLPVGAEVGDGATHFRVWTPCRRRVEVVLEAGAAAGTHPLAEFPGAFGWGYDGVDLYAPTRLYGTPDDFRRFVDRAHGCGLGVILDVVYNHFGPDGNYLAQFAPAYFRPDRLTEWGDAINF